MGTALLVTSGASMKKAERRVQLSHSHSLAVSGFPHTASVAQWFNVLSGSSSPKSGCSKRQKQNCQSLKTVACELTRGHLCHIRWSEQSHLLHQVGQETQHHVSVRDIKALGYFGGVAELCIFHLNSFILFSICSCDFLLYLLSSNYYIYFCLPLIQSVREAFN
jgi:hypothetical protein